jgi:MFS family permease
MCSKGYELKKKWLMGEGAAPKQIGLALAISGFSAGFLPIPAGIISDRFGPRRAIIFSWLMALLGATLTAGAAWQFAILGIIVWSLTWAVFHKPRLECYYQSVSKGCWVLGPRNQVKGIELDPCILCCSSKMNA